VAKPALWWLLRGVIYYTLFEQLAPFAIFFGGRWGRISEGVAFAVVAASVHPTLRRRLAARKPKPS
jgi:hypothetical protein